MSSASPSLRRGDAERFLDQVMELVPLAAASAAAVLAVTSTGSMVVAAALLGVAAGDRRSAAAALLAVAAVAVRFSTTSFDDVAGIQSVLGSAVAVGPPTAAVSAGLAAAALLLAVGRQPSDAGGSTSGLVAATTALAAGGFAAAVAFGHGPGGALWIRVAATLVATGIAGALLVLDARVAGRVSGGRPWVGVVAGAAAVVLAAWP